MYQKDQPEFNTIVVILCLAITFISVFNSVMNNKTLPQLQHFEAFKIANAEYRATKGEFLYQLDKMEEFIDFRGKVAALCRSPDGTAKWTKLQECYQYPLRKISSFLDNAAVADGQKAQAVKLMRIDAFQAWSKASNKPSDV